MQRNLNEAIGSLVHAEDGNIGKVIDFYLDDHKWAIRYLVVETSGLFNRNKVLLSPKAFKKIDWDTKEFFTNLMKEQVRNSPDIDTDKSVSRQHETELHKYYGWPMYWGGIGGIGSYYSGSIPITSYVPAELIRLNQKGEKVSSYKPKGDPNLRSIKEVSGYDIQTDDQNIGHIDNFIVDDETWIIRYLLVDAHKLIHGKKLLISPHWVREVSWEESKIFVDMTLEAIRNSPDFDYSKTISSDYEAKLYEYYGSTLK